MKRPNSVAFHRSMNFKDLHFLANSLGIKSLSSSNQELIVWIEILFNLLSSGPSIQVSNNFLVTPKSTMSCGKKKLSVKLNKTKKMLSNFPTISKKYANQDDYAITNHVSCRLHFRYCANFTICNCLNRIK